MIYTGAARSALAVITADDMKGIRPASEPYAALLARRLRERLNTTWALAEAGAAVSGNRDGDPAGHTCVAISGPSERAATLRTGSADRRDNMRAFSRALRALNFWPTRSACAK